MLWEWLDLPISIFYFRKNIKKRKTLVKKIKKNVIQLKLINLNNIIQSKRRLGNSSYIYFFN